MSINNAPKVSATPAQIALAWWLRHPDMVGITKVSRPEHLRENRAAHDIKLTDDGLQQLDQAFPPPRRKIPLEMV